MADAENGAVRVEAGPLWLRLKRPGKEEWVKRLAVARGAHLELHDEEVVKESVDLSGVCIEPAYQSHIFISHRTHNQQLVTLRARDAGERNWWISVLKAALKQAQGVDCDTESEHAEQALASRALAAPARVNRSQAA